MPRYDYKCKECGHEAEHEHSFKETPEFLCPDCEGSVMGKTFKKVSFKIKHTKLAAELKSRHFQDKEMRQELAEVHMVESISEINCPGGISQVYHEVKASGSATRDQIQKTIEKNEAISKAKNKEWQIGANGRVKERTIEARKMRAKEAAENRKITVQSKK